MNTSPLATAPGQIIGYRKDGRPIFPIAGASSPPEPPAPPVVPPVVPAAPVAPPVAPPTIPATPPAPVAPAAAVSEKVEDLPDWAQKLIGDTRKEAADNRVAKQAETDRVKAILKAAGIETEDDDPIKALETTRATNQSLTDENRTLRVELALGSSARLHGADESLLVAVLAHKGELAKLDPAAADFSTKLDALVKATVEANPKLKGGQAPPVSGIPGSGGPGPAADIDAAIDAASKAGRTEEVIRLRRQRAYAQQA